jgi:hypothetical protein
MLNRKTILTLAALATLGAATLAPTSASAIGGHGFGNGGSRVMGGGHGLGGGGHINLGGRGSLGSAGLIRPPIFVPHWPHRPGIFVRWPRPIFWAHWHRPHYLIDRVVTERVVAPTTLVKTENCNCLTKEYLQDGSVMFKDLCTKEAAIATPEEIKAQAQGASPTQTR